MSDDHSKPGPFTWKFYNLDNVVEELKRLACLDVLDASQLQMCNKHVKRTLQPTSQKES